MIGKTTVLVICIHKRVKSIVFAVSIKFCEESDLAILNYQYIRNTCVFVESLYIMHVLLFVFQNKYTI